MRDLRGLSTTQRRLLFLQAVILTGFACVGGRLFYLQVVKHGDFERMASRQQFTPKQTHHSRGVIQDRAGNLLAMNIELFNVFAHPRQVKDKERAARVLAQALGLPYGSILSKISGDKGFTWIARQVPYERSKAVEGLRLEGVGAEREHRRFYPGREMASHLLGFTGIDNQGLAGLEREYQRTLTERRGLVLAGRDSIGRLLPSENKEKRAGVDGLNLVTTLDTTIQHIAEVELEKAFLKYRCKAASILVMDPHTGEILASANFPAFDPNRYAAYPKATWRDRVVQDQFEPGSTFKTILAAAVLEENLVSEEDRFFCENGSYKTKHGRVVTDHEKYGWLTFREILGYSSNIGMVKLGAELGAEKLRMYAERFGFGAPTGVDLPGEANGLLRPLDRWSGLSMTSIPYGYELSSSPLQVANAYAAIANGGNLMRPYLVKRVEDAEGRIVREFKPKKVRRVCSARTARRLTEMLEWAVSKGTGTAVALPSYPIAGKTGTAYKFMDGRYSRYNYVSSFVGFAPADHPKFVIYVSLDDPRGLYWGGYTAGPVFKEVAKRALAYAMVPTAKPETSVAEEPAPKKFPAFLGLTPGQCEWLARRDGLELEFEGEGGRVVRQSVPVPGGTGLFGHRAPRITLTLGDPTPRTASADGKPLKATMPDLRGKTKRQALALLAPLGVKVSLKGRGIVRTQYPPPGRSIQDGSTCELGFNLPVTRLTTEGPGGNS